MTTNTFAETGRTAKVCTLHDVFLRQCRQRPRDPLCPQKRLLLHVLNHGDCGENFTRG
jgi:hypothetical protein